MTIVRWEPLRELGSLQNEMNRLFNTVFDAPAPANGGSTMRRWMPAMDLVETDEHFVLRADLPGMSEEDIQIEFEDGTLTVSGERKVEHEAENEGYYRVERAFGSISRSLTLPRGSPRGRRRELRPRGARGPHPGARAAQAAPDRDRRGRAADHRGLRSSPAPPARSCGPAARTSTAPGWGDWGAGHAADFGV